jgi:hypothetical protein
VTPIIAKFVMEEWQNITSSQCIPLVPNEKHSTNQEKGICSKIVQKVSAEER